MGISLSFACWWWFREVFFRSIASNLNDGSVPFFRQTSRRSSEISGIVKKSKKMSALSDGSILCRFVEAYSVTQHLLSVASSDNCQHCRKNFWQLSTLSKHQPPDLRGFWLEGWQQTGLSEQFLTAVTFVKKISDNRQLCHSAEEVPSRWHPGSGVLCIEQKSEMRVLFPDLLTRAK